MSDPIALVDYGAGNLTSVRKALRALRAEVYTPSTPADLGSAAGVIIPGVGHFAATAALDSSWRAAILRLVAENRPLLGICLGLQWLMEGSDEQPDLPGLSVLPGRCVRLDGPVKIPHVGWNVVSVVRPSVLFRDLAPGRQVYFTHSFAVPVIDAAVGITEHGVPFASAVEAPPVFGVQFHPEKSGETGMTVLRNFLQEVAGRRGSGSGSARRHMVR
jgi:glutamine amidotransferase